MKNKTYEFDNQNDLASILDRAQTKAGKGRSFLLEYELLHRLTMADQDFESALSSLQQLNPQLYARAMQALQSVIGNSGVNSLHERVARQFTDPQTAARIEESKQRARGFGDEFFERSANPSGPQPNTSRDSDPYPELDLDEKEEEEDDLAPKDQILDKATRKLVERTTGQDPGEVKVRLNDPKADAAGVKGLAEDEIIRLGSKTPGADDAKGLKVRVHEAAHILQFRNKGGDKGEGGGGGGTAAAEYEAASVAEAAMQGGRVQVSQSAGDEALGFTELTGDLQKLWDKASEEATSPLPALAKDPPPGLGTDPEKIAGGEDGAQAQTQDRAKEPVEETVEQGSELGQANNEADRAIEQGYQERPVNVPEAGQGQGKDGEKGEEKDAKKDKEELDKAKSAITGAISETFGKGLETEAGAAPPVPADMKQADVARRQFVANAGKEKAKAKVETDKDFGEKGLEPKVDPFEGVDPELTGIEVPEVTTESLLDPDKVAKVAKDDNVGTDLSEVILVEPKVLEEYLAGEAANAPEKEKAKIEEQRQKATDDILQERKGSKDARQRLIDSASADIDSDRERWRGEQQRLITQKQAEVDRVITDRTGQAKRRKKSAEQEADQILRKAERDAQSKERQAKKKAEEKQREAENEGWLSRGWRWIKEKASAVREAIGNLYKRAKEAVRYLLKKARELAVKVIDAAKDFVKDCLKFIDEHLDDIIAVLPGELRNIAEKYKGQIRDALRKAQKNLDQWAEAFKKKLLAFIDGLEAGLMAALDALENVITLAMEGLEALLTGDLMGWLRKRFPKVAELLDEGLDGVLDKVGEAASGWLEGILDTLGITEFMDSFQQMLSSFADGHSVAVGAMTGCCECFKQILDGMMKAFKAMLDSPIAQTLKGWIESFNQGVDEQSLGILSSVFDVLKTVGGPIYDFVTGAAEMVGSAISYLGDIGQTVWKHIATALGIDPNISPLEAIKNGLQALWDTVAEALAPLKEAITGAMDWIKNESPLKPVFDFFAKIPALWESLKKLWKEITADPEKWLATAAEVLKNSIFGPVMEAAKTIGDIAVGVATAIDSWFGGLLEKLGVLGAMQSAHAFLQNLMNAAKSLVDKVSASIKTFSQKASKFFKEMADGAKEIYKEIKPLLDFVAGLIIAITMTAGGNLLAIPLFLAGNLWLHVLPVCYKEALIDFFLDAFIALIEWVPEPPKMAFIATALRSGALGFLRQLKAAPMEKKVKATDMIAKLFAGDVEFLAGFVVGLAKGIYEGTVGTVVFLFQAVAWLAKLGAKLVSVPITMLLGGDDKDATAGGNEGSDDPDAPDEPDKDQEEDDREVDADVELEEDEVQGDTPAEDSDWDASDPNAPEEDVEGDDDADGQEQDQEKDKDEDQAGPDVTPPSTTADTGDSSSAGDKAPTMPADLLNGKALFEKIFKEGVTKEELEAFLNSVGSGVSMAAEKMGSEGANKLIEALNAEGTSYKLGEIIGTVVGMIAVEVALAVLTVGASGAKTAVTAGAKALQAITKLVPKLAKLLPKLRKALQPLFNAFTKMKSAFGQWMAKIRKYIDDLILWAKRMLKKLGGKAKRKLKPKRKPRGRGKPKKKPRPKKKPSGVRAVALAAATKGWRKAKGRSSKQVVRESAIKQLLRTVKVKGKPGVKVKISLVRRRSTWKVKATARKGIKRATMKVGKGWIAKDTKNKRWYAAKSLAQSNKRLAKDVEKDIKALAKKGKSDAKAKLSTQVENIEKGGDQKLRQKLQGMDMDLKVQKAKGGKEDKKVVKGIIEPNYYEWTVEIDGEGLEEVKKRIQAMDKSGRYNEIFGKLNLIAKECGAEFDIEGPKGFNKKARKKMHYYEITFSKDGEELKVNMARSAEEAKDADGNKKGALSDRPLGAPHGQEDANPHDGFPGAQWEDAIVAVANRTPGVSSSGKFTRTMVSKCRSTTDKNPAVADGKSQQPFDGEVHKDKNAAERRADTRGNDSSDTYITLGSWTNTDFQTSIGDVKTDEYRGKDWDRLSEKGVVAALEVRAILQIKYLKGFVKRDGNLKREMATEGITEAQAMTFLNLLQIEIMKKANVP